MGRPICRDIYDAALCRTMLGNFPHWAFEEVYPSGGEVVFDEKLAANRSGLSGH